jgi:hypothetical protein
MRASSLKLVLVVAVALLSQLQAADAKVEELSPKDFKKTVIDRFLRLADSR